jgi:hypothetical protein
VSGTLVLGLWLSERAAPAARLEAWRTLVAALAGGMAVRVLDLRPTSPAPPDTAPPETAPPETAPATDAELRLLDALERAGAPLERPTHEALVAALRAATSIVTLPAPDRPGTPALLAVEDVLAIAPETLRSRLQAAGQVRARARGIPGPP